MPIYEYQCKGCGGEFEYQQRMSDDPKTVCESCGGLLERLISRSSFLLKGSGWYKDLYSSAKPQGNSSDSSSPSSNNDTGTQGGSKDSAQGGSKDGSKAGSSKPSTAAPSSAD